MQHQEGRDRLATRSSQYCTHGSHRHMQGRKNLLEAQGKGCCEEVVKFRGERLDMMVPTYNPSTKKAEAGRLPQVPG